MALGKIFRFIQNSTICHSIIFCFIVILIYGAYNYGKISIFSDGNNRFYHTEILDNKVKQSRQLNKDKTKVETEKTEPNTDNDQGQELRPEIKKEDTPEDINVIITFTKAHKNQNLQSKFRTTMESMVHFLSVPVTLYIIGDNESQVIAAQIVNTILQGKDKKIKIVKLDIETLVEKLHEIVKEMQKHFSFKPGTYYSDSLFFLSIAIHRVMPSTMKKVIMLDADLKFNNDIHHLYNLFKQFSSENIIGIARENQPVYRHTFHMYRNKNPGTRVGGPPPNGLTGFNSGVLLLDLDKMRKSALYNFVITTEYVQNASSKYMFKGHLGDQDFFTLVSLEHENLFFILPCTWNRQLCIWWKDKGYESVFDQYYNCDGHINIYHGNCNTKIPVLEWEKTDKR